RLRRTRRAPRRPAPGQSIILAHSMTDSRPLLAITMGDPGGIGPEIIAKALGHPDLYERCRPLVIGEARAMEAALRVTNSKLDSSEVEMVDLKNIDIEQHGRGRVSAEVGKAAYEYLERAAEMALRDEVGAIVTAPLNKEAL